MAHVAKFNIPDIAFPPATDGDISPAPAAISSAPPIDPVTTSRDTASVKKRRRTPRIALSKRPTDREEEHVDTEPHVPTIIVHRNPPRLIVEPGAWTTGEEERRIADFIKQRRAIMAQDSSESEKKRLTFAAFYNMVAPFDDPRPNRPAPHIHLPDNVSGIDYDHPGDM
jgi:hypothetical protein